MTLAPSPKVLQSKKEILTYLGASDWVFKKYVKAGLPARYEDGRWCASTKNIDEWWDTYTRISMAKMIDIISDNGDDKNPVK